jgi:hypothetical protein
MTQTLDKYILMLMELRKTVPGNTEIYVSDGRSGVVDELGGAYVREAVDADNDYGVELNVGQKYVFVHIG